MKNQNFRYGILAFDLLWVIAALWIALGLRYAASSDGIDFGHRLGLYFPLVLVALVVWPALYFEMNLDGFKGGWQFAAILSKATVAVVLLMMTILALAFLTQYFYSRLVLLYFAIIFVLGLVALRCIVRLAVTGVSRNGEQNRCVILGNGAVARELATKLAAHPELSIQTVGLLFPSEAEPSNGLASALGEPVTSVTTLQVLELLARESVQKLIIAMPQSDSAEIRKLIAECRKSSIQVYLVPQWYDLYLSKAELLELDGLPLVLLQERNPSNQVLALKRLMDVLLSGAILVLISPLLVSAAFFVYLRKRRAFRAELRCGKDGVPFRMYRFNVNRYATKPEAWERWFVRWSLTELPQLWNVLRGDMSLVGPRPESTDRLNSYSEWQRQRLKVRGGVTGLAQVHGLREQHSSDDKARYDLQYILNCSPLLDLSLILQTAWTLLTRGLRQEPPDVTPSTSLRAERKEFVGQEVVDANRT